MQGLADAARSRSEADWLVGINGTRAMTAFNSRDGGFFLTTVGRVQTPTLAVVVEREEQIRKFVSRDYWEIHASFLAEAGEYPASGSTRSGRRTAKTPRKKPTASGASAKRRPSPMRCAARPPPSPRNPSPPRRRRPAVRPDQPAARGQRQASAFRPRPRWPGAVLYERHKALTYPRTDSRAARGLPAGGEKTFEMLADSGMKHLAPFAPRGRWTTTTSSPPSASSTTPR
jgi:DNA topoisomerase-3